MKSVAPFGGVSPVFTPNPIGGRHSHVAAIRSCSTSRRATRPTASPGGCTRPARNCRIRGSRTRRATPPTIRGAVQRAQGHAVAAGRTRCGSQGLRAGAACRSVDRRARGLRPRRSVRRLGRDGVRAGARSRRHSAAATRFARQTDWLVDACHDATPRPGVERVRMPGENGMKRYRDQQRARRRAVSEASCRRCSRGRKSSALRSRTRAR